MEESSDILRAKANKAVPKLYTNEKIITAGM